MVNIMLSSVYVRPSGCVCVCVCERASGCDTYWILSYTSSSIYVGFPYPATENRLYSSIYKWYVFCLYSICVLLVGMEHMEIWELRSIRKTVAFGLVIYGILGHNCFSIVWIVVFPIVNTVNGTTYVRFQGYSISTIWNLITAQCGRRFIMNQSSYYL